MLKRAATCNIVLKKKFNYKISDFDKRKVEKKTRPIISWGEIIHNNQLEILSTVTFLK